LVTLNPLSAYDAKNFLNFGIVEEVVRDGEIIAEWRVVTWHADVINVELWLNWIAKN
jgi:hypothetical protein